MLIVLMVAEVVPAMGAAFPAITGVVRDSRGAPQMGVLVQLLSPGSAVIAQTYTGLRGDYDFEDLFPGGYQLKATAASFLPTLRENLKVHPRGKTIVNLTLNTLFEAIQWLPAEPRSASEPSDDWKWTLRSSSNRPLLRFLEDGPLVVVSHADGQSTPELEARVAFSGSTHSFGQSPVGSAFEVERSSANGGHLILRADVAPGVSQNAQFVAGYEQQLGPGREIRTFAAIRQTPGIEGASGTQNFQTAIFRSAESVQLGANLTAEIGNQIEAVQGPARLVSNSPFASVAWHNGGVKLTYSVSTSPQVQGADEIADSQTLTPQFSEVAGVLRTQHGLHQEIRIEGDEETMRALVALYQDSIRNPIVGGSGYPGQSELASGDVLYDPLAQVMRMSGPGYAASGFRAEFDRRMGHATWASFSYAQGKALSFPVAESAMTVSQALRTLDARRAQVITGALSGDVDHTGTHWQASYRWQPTATVTPVDLYDDFSQSAYLSFIVRQPIRCGRLLPSGTEALIAVKNLLAQGYRPLLTPDGNTLYFAQVDRSIQGGFSFSF